MGPSETTCTDPCLLEPCGECQLEISPKAKVCPYPAKNKV